MKPCLICKQPVTRKTTASLFNSVCSRPCEHALCAKAGVVMDENRRLRSGHWGPLIALVKQLKQEAQ